MSNNHHMAYPRCQWESHFATRKLRQKPELIVPMDEEIEAILHKEVPVIPVLDHYTAMDVLKEYQPQSRHSRSLTNLMRTIETSLERPRTTEIQRELGQLTVHALELEMVYIHLGAITDYVGDR